MLPPCSPYQSLEALAPTDCVRSTRAIDRRVPFVRRAREHGRGELLCRIVLCLTPGGGRITRIPGIAQLGVAFLASGEGGSGSLRDLPALLLGQCRVEVQHEWISMWRDQRFGNEKSEGSPVQWSVAKVA